MTAGAAALLAAEPTARPAARLDAELYAIRGDALPGWCDAFLEPAGGAFFAGRLWFDTTLAQALPVGAQPLLAVAGPVLLPLLRQPAGTGALATPYSLSWRPLLAAGADAASVAAAGRALARVLAPLSPVILSAVEADAPGLEPLLAGLRAGGVRHARFAHFVNWHLPLAPGLGWNEYLVARPPALRNTIRRKLARAERDGRFDWVAAPGAALEAGIAAYLDVRARSWKPPEPFPDFDAALLRAAAAAGLLRLGVLRDGGGVPTAAQYWIVSGGVASVLKLSYASDAAGASPGTALTALMIRRLLAEGGVRALDFGRGDDPYKQGWTGERRERIGLLLADPRRPAGLLALTRHAAGVAGRRVRDALHASLTRLRPSSPDRAGGAA